MNFDAKNSVEIDAYLNKIPPYKFTNIKVSARYGNGVYAMTPTEKCRALKEDEDSYRTAVSINGIDDGCEGHLSLNIAVPGHPLAVLHLGNDRGQGMVTECWLKNIIVQSEKVQPGVLMVSCTLCVPVQIDFSEDIFEQLRNNAKKEEKKNKRCWQRKQQKHKARQLHKERKDAASEALVARAELQARVQAHMMLAEKLLQRYPVPPSLKTCFGGTFLRHLKQLDNSEEKVAVQARFASVQDEPLFTSGVLFKK